MDVTLTGQSARIVARFIETGRYRTAVEVLDAVLSFCEASEALHEKKLANLRADIQLGLDEAASGELGNLDEFFAGLYAGLDGHLSSAQ